MESNERWRKSSYSGNSGCVEIGLGTGGMILVRDTKDHGHGPVHWFTRAEWQAFTAGLRDGEFHLDEIGLLP